MTSDAFSSVRDPRRLNTLRELGLLDSPAEEAFDRLARFASRLLDTPIALVSLVDEERQFFKSCIGLPEPWSSWRETPLTHSFCQHCVATHEPLVISDARDHPLVRDNLAIPDLNVIAYLGVPLTTPAGIAIGSFCVIDSVPRSWAQEDIDTMSELATSVIREISLRALKRTLEAQVAERTAELERANRVLKKNNAEARASQARISEILERITDAFVALDREWRYTYVNRKAAELFGREPDDLLGKHIWTEFPEGVGQPFQRAYERAMTENISLQIEEYYAPWDRWFENRIYSSPEGISIFFQEITERKRAEASLKDSENRLNLALDAGEMGIFDWDLASDTVVCSGKHARLFGITAEDLNKRYIEVDYHAVMRRLHPDDLARLERALDTTRQTHGLLQQEFRVVWPDGSQHWIASQGSFIYSGDGQALRMTGVISNIDARKRMESLLRSEKAILEMIARGNKMSAILETITHSVELLTTDTFCSILLLDTDGASLRLGAAPSLPREYNNAIDGEKIGPRAGSCGTAAYFNKQVIVSDIATDPLWENYRDLALRFNLRACWSTPICSPAGKVLGTFALYYDQPRSPGSTEFEVIERAAHLAGIAIERERVEADLRASEQHLRNILNSLYAFVGVMTPDGTLLLANRAPLERAGLQAEDVIGKPFPETHWWSYSAAVQQRLWDAIRRVARGETVRYDETVRLKDDQYAVIDFVLTPMLGPDGRVTHMVPSGIDVTERKQAEESLQQLTRELEQRVAERTADLEAFTYMAAHDLRAPLRGMQGMAAILLDDYGDRLDVAGKRCAQRIIKASERLDNLIGDLLTYARVSRESINMERVELASAVDAAWSQLGGGWADKDATLEVATPLPAVYGHQTVLVQALTNLFANAVKFVEQEVSPKVKVYAEKRNGVARLWVEDNGIGIAAEYHERIFSVFERLHAGEAYAGTGVGLAIVRKGIERMGGKVGVESNTGNGSRFWIELPLAE